MSRIPVNQPYTVTTPFGVPDSNAKFGKHSGIDYAGFGAGRPIYAPTSGQLTNIDSSTGGNMVVIFDGKYYHRLMHNSSFSRNNGRVNEGDEVAKAGTTGLSTGVHCHWDVNTQGTYPTSFSAFINPNDWLKQGKQGGDMPLTDKQLYMLFEMAKLAPLSQEEAANREYHDNPGLAIETAYNNYGKDWQAKADALKINDIRGQKLNELGKIVGVDPDKDGIDAIISKVKELHD